MNFNFNFSDYQWGSQTIVIFMKSGKDVEQVLGGKK